MGAPAISGVFVDDPHVAKRDESNEALIASASDWLDES